MSRLALQEALRDGAGLAPLTPEAGERRYFRPDAAAARGWLLVRSPDPPPRASAEWLEACGVRVPRLGAALDDAYLVEDLGDRPLCHEPTAERYRQLLEAWRRLAARPLPADHPCAGRALDAALFRKELELFRELWLGKLRRRASSPAQAAAVAAACDRLAEQAAAAPWCPQHRDFHSRNVLLPPSGGVALIDHQDLRPGPLFYDLASLATDAYVDPPGAVAALLRAEVLHLGRERGLSPEESRLRFHRSALQRVLKALGTFARMLLADRPDYADAEARASVHARALLAQTDAFVALREALD